MLSIGEVDVTHQVQRLFVIGIESEVLEQQLAPDDAHGVIVETHTDAVGQADEIGIVYIDFTVDFRVGSGAFDGELSLAVALKTDELVGNETIGDRQGETGHREVRVELSVFVVMVAAAEQTELLVVEHQVCLDGVAAVFLHQIDHLRADVTDG